MLWVPNVPRKTMCILSFKTISPTILMQQIADLKKTGRSLKLPQITPPSSMLFRGTKGRVTVVARKRSEVGAEKVGRVCAVLPGARTPFKSETLLQKGAHRGAGHCLLRGFAAHYGAAPSRRCRFIAPLNRLSVPRERRRCLVGNPHRHEVGFLHTEREAFNAVPKQ